MKKLTEDQSAQKTSRENQAVSQVAVLRTEGREGVGGSVGEKWSWQELQS